MTNVPTLIENPFSDLSVANLARTIFRAELPEQYVRTLPAESLYLAIKHNGLQSSGDLISMASIEQCRTFLDLDLWNRDELSESNFWDWLEMTDDDHGLELLQKFLKVVDLKIIGSILGKYLDIQISEEKTDSPPGPGYYTTDKGLTWLGIKIEDPTKHFLLGRFLALIHETNSQLFYSLLTIRNVQTSSLLEEEAYQERIKRLASEGIPEPDFAASLHAFISDKEILEILKAKRRQDTKLDLQAIEPLVYTRTEIEPLSSLITEIGLSDDFQTEFTLLANAAIVHFGVPFAESKDVFEMVGCIKGALNIGIEKAMKLSGLSARESFEILGLKLLYRFGLTKLLALRREVQKSKQSSAQNESSPNGLLIEAVNKRFPVTLAALKSDGSFSSSNGAVDSSTKPFEHLNDIDAIRAALKITATNVAG